MGLGSRILSTGSLLALTDAKLSLLESASLPEMPLQRSRIPENAQVLTPNSSGMSFERQYSPSSSGIFTPTPSRMPASLQLPGLHSTLRCPLCPDESKVFGSLPALEAHVTSPAHAPKIFHRPIALLGPMSKGTALRCFTTLSGLTQHLENGACGDGAATLKQAMDFVQEKLDQLGFGGVGLVKE